MSEPYRPKLAILTEDDWRVTESLIDSTQNGTLNAEVGLVISSEFDPATFERVRGFNTVEGLDIKYATINEHTHPDFGIEQPKDSQTLASAEAICKELAAANIGLVALAGYSRRVVGDLAHEYGFRADHNTPYKARMVKAHPGPVPITKNLTGLDIQQAVIDAQWRSTEYSFLVVGDTSTEDVVKATHTVPIMRRDTARSLASVIDETIRRWYPFHIAHFLIQQYNLIYSNASATGNYAERTSKIT